MKTLILAAMTYKTLTTQASQDKHVLIRAFLLKIKRFIQAKIYGVNYPSPCSIISYLHFSLLCHHFVFLVHRDDSDRGKFAWLIHVLTDCN